MLLLLFMVFVAVALFFCCFSSSCSCCCCLCFRCKSFVSEHLAIVVSARCHGAQIYFMFMQQPLWSQASCFIAPLDPCPVALPRVLARGHENPHRAMGYLAGSSWWPLEQAPVQVHVRACVEGVAPGRLCSPSFLHSCSWSLLQSVATGPVLWFRTS